MTATQETGRDWLSMNPAHFDVSKLPKRHRKADPGAMFTVADLLPSPPAKAAKAAPQIDGQGDLFAEDGT